MTFETFLGLFLAFLTSLAETMTAFCRELTAKLGAVKTPAAPPPEEQGGHAPTLPHGALTVDLTPVYIPRVPGASDSNGRITPVKCDLSGHTAVDSKGESYTIVGLALNDAKNRLVCRHGKRAVLRFASDLTIAGVTPAPQSTTPVNSAVNSVDNTPPANKVQQTSVDKRTAQLFDALVSMGVPKTVASLQARSMAESEALDAAKANPSAPTPVKVETVDPKSQSRSGTAMYPMTVPSGVTRVVFFKSDGTPLMNTANQHHGFMVDAARLATPGSPAFKWAQGTHRLCADVASGKLRCEYR